MYIEWGHTVPSLTNLELTAYSIRFDNYQMSDSK